MLLAEIVVQVDKFELCWRSAGPLRVAFQEIEALLPLGKTIKLESATVDA